MNQPERINPIHRNYERKFVGVLRVAKVASGAHKLADQGGELIARIGSAKQLVAVVRPGRIVHTPDSHIDAKSVGAGRKLKIGQGFIREVIRTAVDAGNARERKGGKPGQMSEAGGG